MMLTSSFTMWAFYALVFILLPLALVTRVIEICMVRDKH
jgi:hypothetical protein